MENTVISSNSVLLFHIITVHEWEFDAYVICTVCYTRIRFLNIDFSNGYVYCTYINVYSVVFALIIILINIYLMGWLCTRVDQQYTLHSALFCVGIIRCVTIYTVWRWEMNIKTERESIQNKNSVLLITITTTANVPAFVRMYFWNDYFETVRMKCINKSIAHFSRFTV